MSSDPRICIVGAGGLSSRRIYPNIGLAGGQLVGVCDLAADKAERNARRFGGKPYANLDAMLDAEKPDAVIVCIGPEAHAELPKAILRRGFPVYTEKPPAVDAAGALAVARVAKETGLLCMTAFKKRYTLATQRAKAFMAEFPAGSLMSVSIDYCSGSYPNKTPRNDYLLDFALHCIDLIAYLAGDAKEVFAFTKDQHAFAVSIRFADGSLGVMNLNDGRDFFVPTEETEITLGSGNFMTIHNSSCWRITRGGKPAEWREPPTFMSAGDSGNDTGHLAELVEFVKAVQERRSTASCIAESYKTMVLYEAIRASALSGRVVPIAYETI